METMEHWVTNHSGQEMNNEGNEQGYNYSRLWLNSYLNPLDSWNIANYEERLKYNLRI
jgi:hypothetical protein